MEHQRLASDANGIGPWGPRTPLDAVATQGLAREPLFNAPWPSLVLVAAILAAYAAQQWVGADAVGLRAAFSSAALMQGRWWTLVTALFVHGGWTHAIMNALGALAFGPPVARLLGADVRGAGAFLLFYLVCGALGSLGYAALHWGGAAPLLGASGAVSGLMGAASRLYARPHGLWPVLSRPPLTMAGAWILVNLLIALTGLTPGMTGVVVAWEAHLAGFAAGLLLIGPVARLMRRG